MEHEGGRLIGMGRGENRAQVGAVREPEEGGALTTGIVEDGSEVLHEHLDGREVC